MTTGEQVFNVEPNSYIMRTINNHNYMFHNEMPYSRDGFTHKSTLLRDGNVISSARVHYLNRTWESYQYQTSMRAAAENAFKGELDGLIAHYKAQSGKSRISAEKKKEISESTPLLLELRELLASL